MLRSPGGLLLDIAYTNVGSQLPDLAEIPIDDVPRLVGEWRRPVAEELADDSKRGGRHSACVRQAFDRRAMCCLRSPADSIDDEHSLIPILQRLNHCERKANLGMESADDQTLAPGLLHRVAERAILECVH